MNKSLIIFMVLSSLILSGITFAAYDITSPGDPLKGVPDVVTEWPAGEAPPFVIDDNINTKYLHFGGDVAITGFQVTPSHNGVVTGLSFTTANDAAERDPVHFELYGSNVTIDGPYTLIAGGDVLDFSQPDPWPRMTKNETPISFSNTEVYTHYQVLITAVRTPGNGCCMQVAEVELLVETPPTAWAYKDIGTSGGHAWEEAGTYNVRSDGGDIWDVADQFGYVYRPVSGDFEFEVALDGITTPPPSDWTKVGVMVRETTDPGSRHAMMALTGNNGWQFLYRTATDGGSAAPPTMPKNVFPEKLMIKRIRDFEPGIDKIEGWYYRVDLAGILEYWFKIDDVNMPAMPDDVLIGLAVTSHTGGQLCYAQYSNVNWPAAPYEKPWDMRPGDGAVDVPADLTMTWLPGDSATSHDVYLGTDPGALALVDTKALGDESYTPSPPLMEGVTYYWQVVEQPLGVGGPVYSFTTYLPPPPPLGIERCIWLDIGGTAVSDLTNNAAYPDSPSWCDQLNSMASYDFADNYGGQMQGLLWPENSGDYTFWIAADDGCELWLSTDENPDNLVRIAYHNAWTGAHNWFWYAEQQSAPVTLVGGQKYFIRALWKEGGGGDNCEVAWYGPDQPTWPVDGSSSAVITDYYFPPLSLQTSILWPPEGPVTLLEAKEGLSWKGIRAATAYNVYFGEDGGSMPLVYSGLATSIATPPIEVGKTYNWKVDVVTDSEIVEGNVSSFTVQEWVSLDIGRANPEPAGSASYDEATGVYTLKSGGNELWGNADEFHYLYTTMKMTRDEGSIKARVLGITYLGADWARGGVQIRESRAPNAAKVMAHKTAADNTRMQFRDSTGAGTGNNADNYGLGFPTWVRMDRNGNQYNGYYSLDGENWSSLGGRTVTMTKDYVCVGLALCHHNGAPQDQLTTGTFDNLSVYTPDIYASWGPSPGNDAENVPMVDVILRWNAGQDAEQHLLYFSENYEDVKYGLVEPIVLPVGTTEYSVGKLDLTKVYYWAVDEVRREGRDMLTALGDIWSFKVENFRLIDDFEQYCITPEPIPPQVEVPGDIIIEAVPPPDQAWVEPVTIVIDDGPQIVDDPDRGQVLALDGNGDWVNCGNPAALNFGTGNWTLSAWIQNTMTGTGDSNKGSVIANGGDTGGGKRYCLIQSEQSEGKVTLVVDDDSTKVQARGDTTLVNDGVWHHVLGLRDGDEIRIYIDGALEGSAGLPAGYDLSGTVQHDVLIGGITDAPDPDAIYKIYEGMIDDVRIYDSALSEDNIAFLADKGGVEPDPAGLLANWAFEGDFTDSSGNGFDGTPIGYLAEEKPGYYSPCIVHWAMDEGAGDTVADSSGNGLDGIISGAAWTAVTADGSAACLDFDGLGGNVVNEAAGPYLNNLAGLSISMWIQSDLIDTDKGFIIGRDPEGNDQRGIRYDSVGASGGGDDVIKYGVACTDGADESESSVGIQTTDWQHIVMVWDNDGTGTQLYVNGVMDVKSYDGDNRTGLTAGYTKLLVGKGGKGAADSGWDGRIDDVQVYDYRLSEGEIRYLAGIGDLLKPPTYEPLVAHYEFEGNYDDSSGNNRTATPIGAGISIETDPIMGQVLSLPGGDNIFVEVGSVGISGNDPTTIACWAKADNTSIPDWTLVFGFTGTADGGGGNGSHFNIGSLGGPGGVGAHCWGWEETIFSDQEALDWHHYAMTYDGTTILYYGDGFPMDTDPGKSNVQDLSIRADRVHIGSRITQASSFPGKVDDARVYNIVLTPEQISNIYGCVNTIGNNWEPLGPASVTLDYLDSHMGVKSMKIEGSQTVKAQHKTIFRDWASGGAKALVLYFKGHPDNVVHDMSVILQTKSSASTYHTIPYEGDLANMLSEDWTEWNVDLSDIIGDVVWMAVGFHGSGVIHIDDIGLYPPRCVPELSLATDLNKDCVVNGKDLRLLLGEWLAEEQVQDWEYRAAYYDARYPTGWADTPVAEGVRDYLSAAGYTVLDADELKTWMDARIADGALSVVVMCQDIAPDTVAETRDASCTLRRYLDAGGKVVQYADIPFYNQGHADGTTTNWATDGSVYILGFNAAGAAWDSGNTVTITDAGAIWGLNTPWPSNRPARAIDVSTILAADNDGDASGWAKHYVGGDNYRGFVYIADFDPDSSVIPLLGPALLSVAEYKGALLYDLYEDGANNFKDYDVLTGDWLEQIVWP